ncbi:MAG: hypothetical protein R2857_11545 [Vampirovibrionales bacterium]
MLYSAKGLCGGKTMWLYDKELQRPEHLSMVDENALMNFLSSMTVLSRRIRLPFS